MKKDIKEIKNQEVLSDQSVEQLFYNEINIFNYYLEKAMPQFYEKAPKLVDFEPSDSEVHYLGYSPSSDLFVLGFYLADPEEVSYAGFWGFRPEDETAFALHLEKGTSFYNPHIKDKAQSEYPDLLDIILD